MSEIKDTISKSAMYCQIWPQKVAMKTVAIIDESSAYKDTLQKIIGTNQSTAVKAGFAAENFHARTFNLDAIQNDSNVRAYTDMFQEKMIKVNDPVTDIGLFENGKQVHSVQSKYYRTADDTFKAMREIRDGAIKYEKADSLLGPADQINDIKTNAHKTALKNQETRPQVADAADMVEDKVTSTISYDGNQSTELTAKEARDIAQNNEVGQKKINDIETQYLNKALLSESFRAARSAAIITTVTAGTINVFSTIRAYKQGELSLEQAVGKVTKETAIAAADGALKAGVSTASVGLVARAFPSLFSGSAFTSSLATGSIAGTSICLVDLAYCLVKVGAGQMTTTELEQRVGTNALQTSAGVFGASIGAAVGAPAGPVGMLVGSLIGGMISSVGASIAIDVGVEKNYQNILQISQVRLDTQYTMVQAIDYMAESAQVTAIFYEFIKLSEQSYNRQMNTLDEQSKKLKTLLENPNKFSDESIVIQQLQTVVQNSPEPLIEVSIEDTITQNSNRNFFLQQLALDASKMLTISEKEVGKLQDCGFFKRISLAITGKKREIQQKTQISLLEMQKFSWQYLQELQRQNRLNVQTMVIVRNNLSTLANYVIETRTFLEAALIKINKRLTAVESGVGLNKWSVGIEANKRKYMAWPKHIRCTLLAFDFAKNNPKQIHSDDINYLINTLEKLDINCEESIYWPDFLLNMIYELDQWGFDHFTQTIDLSDQNRNITFDYIKQNISSPILQAFYVINTKSEELQSIINDEDFVNSDERDKAILDILSKDIEEINSSIITKDLLSEIVGASLLAIQLYDEQLKLPTADEEHFTAQSSLDDDIAIEKLFEHINEHTLLSSELSDTQRIHYLSSLVLCVDDIQLIGKDTISFVKQLSKVAKIDWPVIWANITGQKLSLQTLIDLLDDNDKKYTWLLDCKIICDKLEGLNKDTFEYTIKKLELENLVKYWPDINQMIHGENDIEKLEEVCLRLNGVTTAWKNIIHYKKTNFSELYIDIVNALRQATFELSKIALDMTMLSMEVSNDMMGSLSFEDDNLFTKFVGKVSNTLTESNRANHNKKLNNYRQKIYDFITDNFQYIHKANRLCHSWGLPEFNYEVHVSAFDYEIDTTVRDGFDDDWHEVFNKKMDELESACNHFESTSDNIIQQLGYFSAGQFERSRVLEIQQARQKYLEDREKEKKELLQEKQQAIIKTNSGNKLIRIEWSEALNFPCDYDEIYGLKAGSNGWLLCSCNTDSQYNLYFSRNGVDWICITYNLQNEDKHIRNSDMKFIKDTWFIFDYSGKYWYSTDGLNWQKSHDSDDDFYSLSSNNKLFYYNNYWYCERTDYYDYDYIEKGIIWDSEKTSSARTCDLYRSRYLGNKWELCEKMTPHQRNGIYISTYIPTNKLLLAVTDYDYGYFSNCRKNDTFKRELHYYREGKDWRTCSLEGEAPYIRDDAYCYSNENGLFLFSGTTLLVSQKGYEWEEHNLESYWSDFFIFDDILVMTSVQYQALSVNFFLAQDNQSSILVEGDWENVATNNSGVIAVFRPNEHEGQVMYGRWIIEDS